MIDKIMTNGIFLIYRITLLHQVQQAQNTGKIWLGSIQRIKSGDFAIFSFTQKVVFSGVFFVKIDW